MEIKYIGGKQLKKDNVCHTGVVWRGNGDVREVPDSAAVALLAYPEIWVKVDAKPALPEFKFSEDTTEAIAEAIGLLDPKNSEHYTKLDQPRVEAIEMLLGYDINTQQRDEGYFLFRGGEGAAPETVPETVPETATDTGERVFPSELLPTEDGDGSDDEVTPDLPEGAPDLTDEPEELAPGLKE